ncbi:hypothetical protein [Streptomyces niveus]|uniref:hypothetical protein n=1 Tax=Streptomyces niveus TaxID=193462 RepID=UPI00341DEC29
MHDEQPSDRRAWVVLGGVHLLNRTAPRQPDEPIVLVRVPPQEVCQPATTVIVRWNGLGPCLAEALHPGGTRLGAASIDGGELFPDAIAGPALRGLVGAEAGPGLVPLCYLAEHPGGGYHAYAQIRFYPEDACFVRTTRDPVGCGPVEELRWLDPVLMAHAESSMLLNNHLRYFRKHFKGTELEFKYTLDPAPDIWAASMELLKALREGELDGCRPEYREEFQIHHTENHLFDVTGPEPQIGYASFIPTVTAGHVLKRKWFTEDTFARREELTTGLNITPDRFGRTCAKTYTSRSGRCRPSNVSATTSSASRCAPATFTEYSSTAAPSWRRPKWCSPSASWSTSARAASSTMARTGLSPRWRESTAGSASTFPLAAGLPSTPSTRNAASFATLSPSDGTWLRPDSPPNHRAACWQPAQPLYGFHDAAATKCGTHLSATSRRDNKRLFSYMM